MFNDFKETDGMKLMTIFAALLAAFAVGGGIALATGGGSSSGIDLTGTTTELGTTTGDDGDISGPCDEAEHANEPRCTGVTVPGADDNGDDDGPRDISGPCDEAEHANDPRCTGANPGDSSGPGPGGQDDDDRSGHSGDDNSGPSGDDNSGHGSGGGDDDDDNSGPGSGSGSGSSGSG